MAEEYVLQHDGVFSSLFYGQPLTKKRFFGIVLLLGGISVMTASIYGFVTNRNDAIIKNRNMTPDERRLETKLIVLLSIGTMLIPLGIDFVL